MPRPIEGETRHTDDYLQLYHKGWHSFRTGTFRQCNLPNWKKAKKLAVTYENDPLLLLIYRTELKYLSTLGFEGISEKELVSKQMQINDVMKYARNTNLHLQLYDILKYRITYKGYARSNKQKENLNDLVLSELNLIANHSYQGFEAHKLHLLFQATYYLNAGNYKSAIRFYQELIALFEANRHLILNPPIYYLSAIEGVLNSLHVAGLYREMPFVFVQTERNQHGQLPNRVPDGSTRTPLPVRTLGIAQHRTI